MNTVFFLLLVFVTVSTASKLVKRRSISLMAYSTGSRDYSLLKRGVSLSPVNELDPLHNHNSVGDSLAQKIQEAQETVNNAKEAVDDAKDKVDDAKDKVDDAQDELDDAQETLATAEETLTTLKKQGGALPGRSHVDVPPSGDNHSVSDLGPSPN